MDYRVDRKEYNEGLRGLKRVQYSEGVNVLKKVQ
jgi:hypothetical protein